MKKLLKEMTQSLVEHPDDVAVEEEVDHSDMLMLKLKVHPEDMGRIIGKEGKIIQALRTLLRVAALKQGKRVHVELIETQLQPAKTLPSSSESN